MPLMLVFNGMESGTQTWYQDLDTGAIVQVFPGSRVPVRAVNDYENYVDQGVAEVTGDEDGSDGRLDEITDGIRAVMVAVAPLEGDPSSWTLDDMIAAIAVVQEEDAAALEEYASIPEVASTTPADSAVGVALDAVISVTFIKSMDPATLVASNFTIDPVDVETPAVTVASVSVSDSNKHVVYHLDAGTPLINEAAYKITVKRAVHDMAGHPTAEGALGEGHYGYSSPNGFTTIAD